MHRIHSFLPASHSLGGISYSALAYHCVSGLVPTLVSYCCRISYSATTILVYQNTLISYIVTQCSLIYMLIFYYAHILLRVKLWIYTSLFHRCDSITLYTQTILSTEWNYFMILLKLTGRTHTHTQWWDSWNLLSAAGCIRESTVRHTCICWSNNKFVALTGTILELLEATGLQRI